MLARQSLLGLLTHAVGGFVGLASLFLIGRTMAPEAFGSFAFALGLAGLATFLARFGIDDAHVKRVSEGQDLGACLTVYGRAKTVLVVAFLALFLAASWGWARARGFHDATTLPVLALAALYAGIAELRQVPLQTFLALRHAARFQAAILAEHAARLAAVAIACAAFGSLSGLPAFLGRALAWLAGRPLRDPPASPEAAAFAIAAAYAATLVASLLVARASMASLRLPRRPFDRALLRSYVRFAAPIGLVAAITSLPAYLDVFLLGYFWSASEVGAFYGAQRVAAVSLVLPATARLLFFPMISELAARREAEGARAVAGSTLRVLSLVLCGSAMLLVVLAAPILHVVLSDSYVPAAPALRILALANLAVGLAMVPAAVLMGGDRPRAIAAVGLVATAVDFTLNLLLIPDSLLGVPLAGWRGTGAALATLAGQGVALVLLWRHASRQAAGPRGAGTVLRHLACAAAAGALLLALLGLAPAGATDRFYGLAGAALLGVALYVALLVLVRALTRRDLDVLLDILNPAKLVAHVRDEWRGPSR